MRTYLTAVLLLVFLKSIGALNLNWFWTLSILWVPLGIFGTVFLALGLAFGLFWVLEKLFIKEEPKNTGLYLVTTEINENWFRRVLRKLGLNKRGNFRLRLSYHFYEKGEVLNTGNGSVLILRQL